MPITLLSTPATTYALEDLSITVWTVLGTFFVIALDFL